MLNGVCGAYLENISPFGKQLEFLFDYDCAYRILDISGNRIVLEVL